MHKPLKWIPNLQGLNPRTWRKWETRVKREVVDDQQGTLALAGVKQLMLQTNRDQMFFRSPADLANSSSKIFEPEVGEGCCGINSESSKSWEWMGIM